MNNKFVSSFLLQSLLRQRQTESESKSTEVSGRTTCRTKTLDSNTELCFKSHLGNIYRRSIHFGAVRYFRRKSLLYVANRRSPIYFSSGVVSTAPLPALLTCAASSEARGAIDPLPSAQT